MTSTVTVRLTDAEITRQASGEARELRDARYPELRFRFLTDRRRGSWHVVVGGVWEKAASYPSLNTQAVVVLLPQLLAKRAANPDASVKVCELPGLADLLRWYQGRLMRDRNISAKRKATCKSVLERHLIPRLDGLEVVEVSKPTLDRRLLWPLQEEYSVAYVRQVYGVLATALVTALRLGQIPANPLAGVKFGDFVTASIKPKPAQLRAGRLQSLLGELHERFEEQPVGCMLALVMLCHGTRIGETRKALRSAVDLGERSWLIPAPDTKTRVEHVLPITDQVAALMGRYLALINRPGLQGRYLFPNGSGLGLSAKQASDFFKVLGQGEWTSHDLRKLARTSWAELGVDFLTGERLLNHSMGAVVAAYMHTTAEELKRKALEDWHAYLDGKGFAAIHGETEPRPHVRANAVEACDAAASGVIPHQSKVRMQGEKGEVVR